MGRGAPTFIVAGSLIVWGRSSSWALGGVRFDSVFAFWIILGSAIVFPAMRRIRIDRLVSLVGEHSMNIFLLHTFLYCYFLPDFFYQLKNPLVVFVVLLLASLAVSVALEGCKRIVGVPRLERFIREYNCDRIKLQTNHSR